MTPRRRWTHHTTVGYGYLLVAGAAVLVGVWMSLRMRMHLAWPDAHLPGSSTLLPEEYLRLVTLHGTLMLFYVATVAPLWGFGNLILPAQIGSRRTSFPRLNAAGLLLTALGLMALFASALLPTGAPISGWTAYPPLSAISAAGPGQALGMDLWLLSLALFCAGSLMAAVNMVTTVICLRADGMTPGRLPLSVWGWFTSALLGLPAFSVLLAALMLLFSDRHLGTGFFLPSQLLVNQTLVTNPTGGSPLLWLHLFWFFGHPEVYIAVLPGMGLTSMVLANFARRPVAAYRLVIVAMLLVGWLGILVWGHHMFVAGLSPFAGSAFAVSTIAIAVPASAEVLSWLATMWGSRPRLATPMLFALGFVSFFITGGLTGPILAQPILDQYLHNTFFVVAHFHLIMSMAVMFGLFTATYYWFPLLAGRALSERLGRWHFAGSLLGAYLTFLPMHLTGLAGEPRHYAQFTGIPGPGGPMLLRLMPLQRHISTSAFLLAASQLFFVANLLLTLRKPRQTVENPWSATTMEWAPGAMQPHWHPLVAARGPCEYSADGNSFEPQWEPPLTQAGPAE